MPRVTFENKITLNGVIQIALLLAGLAGLYYGIVGRIELQAADIDQLQRQVAPIPAIENRMTAVEATIAAKGAARDKQFADLAARVDQNQSSADAKLDKIMDSLSALNSSVAALNATIKATSGRP